MKLKIVWIAILIMSVLPFSYAGSPETKRVMSSEAQKIHNRLEEIKSMPLSDLPKVERKKLRNEVMQLKQKIRPQDGVIVISAGTLVLIIILLIILL